VVAVGGEGREAGFYGAGHVVGIEDGGRGEGGRDGVLGAVEPGDEA
jgi:hypothetical protein